MKEKAELKDKIFAVSCKADQLGTIAWVAAISSFNAEQCERIFKDVLYGIKGLSEQIAAELEQIADEIEIECDLKEAMQADGSDKCRTDTSLEKWCDELLSIFKRLDWFGRSEVLLYADKVEKKRLNEA